MGPASDTSEDDEKEAAFTELVVVEDDDDAIGSKASEVRPAVASEEPEALNSDLMHIVPDQSEEITELDQEAEEQEESEEIDPTASVEYALPMDRAILENPNFNYKDYLESKRH